MKHYLIFLIFLISCNLILAQVDREFWFAIPKETSGHGTLDATNSVSFKITAMSLDAQVTISMPANPAFINRNINVSAGRTHIETIASSWAEFEAIYNNSAAYNAVPVSGINNRGFLIQSNNDITVYYDYDNYYNRELFALKGKNALGTDFFVPFQNIWYNDSAAYNPDPYSTVDIVATEDNTTVTITPQPGQRVHGRNNDSAWNTTLNRGQSYCLRAMYMKGSAHLSGIRVQSDKNIAVSTNDDSERQNGPSCRDILGDQLIPTNKIGSEYVVMTGDRSNTIAGMTAPYHYATGVGEQIFVVATQPNTVIQFWGRDGSTVYYQTPALNAGQTDYISVDISVADMSSIYIKATDLSKKFYVFHITGIGCELGGAILPPITSCSGSNEVSFYRSNTLSDITVNLMVPYDNTKLFTDPTQSHNYFHIVYQDGSSFAIPGSWFEANVGSGWAVLKITNRNFNTITSQGQAHKIINSKDYFHMGMTNGTSGQAGKYGYFSSFNVSHADVRVGSTEESDYIGCFGESITLIAKGGLEYTWHYGTPSGPPTYLSDPKSPTPQVINCPVGSHNFYVEVQQAKCFGIDTLKLSLTILQAVNAIFTTDKTAVCALDTVKFTNLSVNADLYKWKKQIGSGPDTLFHPINNISFADTLDNKNSVPIQVKYTLIAESYQGCSDTVTQNIAVYPRITASFSPTDTIGFSPLFVSFKNHSIIAGTAEYNWNFGDYGTSNIIEPFHQFINNSGHDTTYKVKLIVNDLYYCKDSAYGIIKVKPLITGINKSNLSESKFSIHPIPAKDIIDVQYSIEKPCDVNIELYTTTGKLIYTQQEYKTQIGTNISKLDITQIKDKIFVIKAKVAGKTYTLKGIKE